MREARKEILIEQKKLITIRITELQKALEKLDFKIENYDTIILEAERKFAEEK